LRVLCIWTFSRRSLREELVRLQATNIVDYFFAQRHTVYVFFSEFIKKVMAGPSEK